jgi:hypothetical protein
MFQKVPSLIRIRKRLNNKRAQILRSLLLLLSRPRLRLTSGLFPSGFLTNILQGLYFGFEYAIRRVQENQEGLIMNGTHQVFAYAKALLEASKKVGLDVNPEKTKYMLVSRCQKAEHKDRD